MTLRRRLRAVFVPLAVVLGLLVVGGAGGAAADATPTSYLVSQGGLAVFSPNAITATLTVPPQCAGSHAAIAVTNLTTAAHSIEYYGGTVSIPPAGTHYFCIGGTANGYWILYAVLGENNVQLHVWVP